MKVAQNNETISDMQLVRPPHTPSISNTQSVYLSDASNYLNMELSPSGHLSDTGPEPGKHSRLTSPFSGIV